MSLCVQLRRVPRVLVVASALLTGAACSPSSLVDVQAPSTVVDPSLVGTVSGAIQLRAAAIAAIGWPLANAGDNNLILMGGLFTDELTDGVYAFPGPDERHVNDVTFGGRPGYGVAIFLYQSRSRIQLARQALQLYATGAADAPKAWQGELYALEGFTVLWLAEYFCSGMPLTDVKLVGTSVPTAGFTTTEMFTRAAALFDSALVAGADSATYVNLARVGKARALLGLGAFAAADSAAREVPTNFVYTAPFSASLSDYQNAFSNYEAQFYTRVQDREGRNGLVWSTDPRTGIVPDPSNGTFLRPAKYNVNGGMFDPFSQLLTSPVRIADGLEARLIQAEAALAAGSGAWLDDLNAVRRACVEDAPCAPVPGLTAANLPDTLTDPGVTAARVDLLFRERAMWLYLTGHRLGDWRRLVHQYHRDPATLWPVGTIASPAFPPLTDNPLPENGTQYGNDYVFASDPSEATTNPLYGGCYDLNP